MPIDVPPQLHERVVCSIAAATKYEIPANIMLAVAEQENGKPGQWVRNENGTLDVGTLQFNTAYLVARGVSPLKITLNYASAADFIAENTTAVGRHQNQRVEIDIVYVPTV